jgi:malonate-semialdehyde dehydrogenase (acetylating)/methylmalonate-semialdehyde dehydrogenase
MNQLEIIGHFIGGHVVDTAGERYAEVFNPALGEPCAKVTLASVDEVNAAVFAASAAFPAWSATPPLARARILFKYLQLCQQHTDEFAAMITREHGKTFSDAQGEVARGIEVVEFAF